MSIEIKPDGDVRQRFNFVDRDLIRACVHCGLCLSYCPTYRVLGSELDSPRGRIYQMRMLADGKITADNPRFREHINLCLNCRACETACPSGVHYGQLLEHARAVVPPKHQTERTLRTLVLNQVFTTPALLDTAGYLMRFYQKSGLQWLARRSGLLEKLPLGMGRLEGLLPKFQGNVDKVRVPRFVRARGKRRHRVAFISGCVQSQFFGLTNMATVRVLAENGCDVYTPDNQVCCGALHVHSGERKTAQDLAKRNIAAFEEAGAEYYIINAAGCGSTLKEYGELLEDDPAWAERAHDFSRRVRDVSEFLVEVGLVPPKGAIRKRVTYQDACHLAHGQRVREQPREILRSIPGLELVEMENSDFCCGSAGIYNVVNFDMSMEILRAKIDTVAATKADILAAANPGCIIQLLHGLEQRGIRMEVAHPIDLLDRAYRLSG